MVEKFLKSSDLFRDGFYFDESSIFQTVVLNQHQFQLTFNIFIFIKGNGVFTFKTRQIFCNFF